MIGRMCTVGDGLSRPVLIARKTFSNSRKRIAREEQTKRVCCSRRYYYLRISQDIYCGGYSGEDPPLPIPNREVKLTRADGTDPPVGRVGRRRFSKPRASSDAWGFLRKTPAPTKLSIGGVVPQTPCPLQSCPEWPHISQCLGLFAKTPATMIP